MSDEKLVLVSVVVPVHNGERELPKLLHALLNQSYPSNKTEIIVVDNNSSDRTQEICSEFSIRYVFDDFIQSSYRARNVGADHAVGELILFIDADCIPEVDWLEVMVNTFYESRADLLAGIVKFYSSGGSISELYDSVFCIQTERLIRERNVATTSNLLVSKSNFLKIGGFDECAYSGGDIEFTARATMFGLKLLCCREAVVKHPARQFKDLRKKMIRTAQGKTYWKVKYRADNEMLKRMKGQGIKVLFRPNMIINKMSELNQFSYINFTLVLCLHFYFLALGFIYQKLRELRGDDEKKMV